MARLPGNDLREALERALAAVVEYRAGLSDAPVGPGSTRSEIRESLPPFPDEPTPLVQVVEELIEGASPGLMGSAGPRYYGFVIGGTLDAALVADVLTTGWDQCAYNEALSPAAIGFEDVAGSWVKQILRLPATASVGFATGAQGANTVGLAAGRWHVLHQRGWDVGRDGLHGAPPISVVVGAERHATIDRAVRLLGLGESALVEVPAQTDGSIDVDRLRSTVRELAGRPIIVCLQAGNVNTGACDDMRKAIAVAREVGAWIHVDGAFGLWARASRSTAHLVEGVDEADSWACDGHKWLNVSYDCGYAVCAHPDVHATALAYTASYLTGQSAGRELGGGDFVPESSRRARGFATWAALRSLGRTGVEELVDRSCENARRFAERLGASRGFEIANDVVLNQVLVRVGDADFTQRFERAIQEDRTCWLGGTTWRGERLLRIAVSNWSTTAKDVDHVVDTMVGLRADLAAGR